MYKITATLVKPGGLPVSWTWYSEKKLTQQECEKMWVKAKEPGKSFGEGLVMTDFACVRVKPSRERIVYTSRHTSRN